MMPQGDRMWVGFNSKGALASVDHLHFHVGLKNELIQPGKTSLYIEKIWNETLQTPSKSFSCETHAVYTLNK